MTVRKWIALILAAVLLLSLTGCGEKEVVVEETYATVPDSEAHDRTERGLGHMVEYLDKRGRTVATRYHTSPREVDLRAGYHDEELIATVDLGYPKVEPFNQMTELRLGTFEIYDTKLQLVTAGEKSESVPLSSGTAVITLKLPGDGELTTGIYHLKVEYLIAELDTGEALDLVGPWDFSFAID